MPGAIQEDEDEEERRRSTVIEPRRPRPTTTTEADEEALVPSRSLKKQLKKQLTGIGTEHRPQTLHFEVGSGIEHPQHGPGRIVEIMTDKRAKPYQVQFENGEVHHCSAVFHPPICQYAPLHQVHHYSLDALKEKYRVGDKAKMFENYHAPTLVKKKEKRLTGWSSQKDLFAQNPVIVFKRGCTTNSEEMTHDDFKKLVPHLDEVWSGGCLHTRCMSTHMFTSTSVSSPHAEKCMPTCTTYMSPRPSRAEPPGVLGR